MTEKLFIVILKLKIWSFIFVYKDRDLKPMD